MLTESLVDMDHKLLLILNKVDQFDQVPPPSLHP